MADQAGCRNRHGSGRAQRQDAVAAAFCGFQAEHGGRAERAWDSWDSRDSRASSFALQLVASVASEGRGRRPKESQTSRRFEVRCHLSPWNHVWIFSFTHSGFEFRYGYMAAQLEALGRLGSKPIRAVHLASGRATHACCWGQHHFPGPQGDGVD